MVSYLQIEDLTKSYGDRLLFSDVTFGVFQGDKIGLVARNGAGKSTLLRIIAGEEDRDSGNVTFRSGLRTAFLSQTPDFDPAKSLVENFRPFAPEELHDWELEARRTLGMLGVRDLDARWDEMSGGQQKRAALARVVFSQPDFLILDEPTNHLDIEIIEWLEDYLQRQKVTLLMVTHDRYFLDKVCNRILEIDAQQVYSYSGNYDYYVEKRDERHEAESAELARVRNLLRTEREWMRRQPQARGSKAKYRIDNFYELEKRSQAVRREGTLQADVKSSYIGSKIFEAKEVCKTFGDKKILQDFSYVFARYEKVGLVGPNGVGKTTFLRMLLGELPPDSGSFDIGETVKWGYYSQAGMPLFDEKKKVIDAVTEIAETVEVADGKRVSASAFLNMFLFTRADQQKYIGKLSGGERRRLYLATVLKKRPNFLVLDEPTNDLDIVTLTVLEDYLLHFKGCVIIVSHDRFFLDRVADHLFVFKGDGKVKDFPGSYSEYRHCLRQEESERKALEDQERGKARTERPAREKKPGLTYKEKREKEELERWLDEAQSERRKLEEAMSAGTMSTGELSMAASRIAEIIDGTDEREMRLLELMEKEEG